MRRLNIVKAVVSGGSGDRLAAAAEWRDADSERVLAAAGIRGSAEVPLPPLDRLGDDFSHGRLHVLGEIDSASFLTPPERRDIFDRNAVRFLRLQER